MNPRDILVVQLDHLGDAVLSTPLIADCGRPIPRRRSTCWPRRATTRSSRRILTNEVKVASRTWFERRPDRWGLVTAVWNLGWSLRGVGYDLGIDVRGDVLT